LVNPMADGRRVGAAQWNFAAVGGAPVHPAQHRRQDARKHAIALGAAEFAPALKIPLTAITRGTARGIFLPRGIGGFERLEQSKTLWVQHSGGLRMFLAKGRAG